MAQPDAEKLAQLGGLRRQLRDIKGVVEARPGVFVLAGKPFIELVGGEVVAAELRAGGGLPAQRYSLGDALASRKLVDEARRRAQRSDDD